jgi:hypothetical protein
MTGTSSYQRSSKYLRERGFMVVKTETSDRGLKHDLLGILDAIALAPDRTVGVQACGGSDFAEHVRTITTRKRSNTIQWLAAGNELLLIGWRKIGRPARWTPRLLIFELDHMGELVHSEVLDF